MVVDFEDCRRDLIDRSRSRAEQALENWKGRSGYEAVVDWVTSFKHEYLFEITPGILRRVKEDSEHALGDVQSEEQIQEVEDFTCPFALEHLFHMYVERHRELPLWQDWWSWLRVEAEPGFVGLIKEQLGWREAEAQERRKYLRAVRWRVGKFYYSAFREVEFLTRMREVHGVCFSYHVLADVLLRADFWTKDTVLCTYFPNPRYRSGEGGRKPSAEKFLGDADPPLTILDVEVE